MGTTRATTRILAVTAGLALALGGCTSDDPDPQTSASETSGALDAIRSVQICTDQEFDEATSTCDPDLAETTRPYEGQQALYCVIEISRDVEGELAWTWSLDSEVLSTERVTREFDPDKPDYEAIPVFVEGGSGPVPEGRYTCLWQLESGEEEAVGLELAS